MTAVSLLKDIKTTFTGGSYDSYPRWLTPFDEKIFFSAVDNGGEIELWATDGSEAGTNLVSNLAGIQSGNPKELSAGRYVLTYSAFTPTNGRELWFTTASPYSTGPYGDIFLGSSSSSPKNIIKWFDAPVFSAKDNDGKRYLWRSDIGIEKISQDHILPNESLITKFKDDIYFVGNYRGEGDALWKYDGNSFTEIFDYYPDSEDNTVFRHIQEAGDLLYFSASSSTSDQLFSTDGTSENTGPILSREEDDQTISSPDNLINVDGTLYFTASTNYGNDIWKTNGTNEGATLVDPTNRSRGINRAKHLTLVDNKIFYVGTYEFDTELWVYDTLENTSRRVKDINTSGDSLKRIDNTLTPFKSKLLFVAEDELHGEELWITNGQEGGTYRLTDLKEGVTDSDVDEITILGDKVIFRSDSDDHGIELFVWDSELADQPSQPETAPENYETPTTDNDITGTNKNDRLKGGRNSDYINGKKGDDKLIGAKGNDVLDGSNGDDILNGSKGKDYLNGSKGLDILKGGKGADVFQVSRGLDIVKDFSIRQGDRIGLDKKGNYSLQEHTDGVLIQANSKKLILLEGVDYDNANQLGVDLFVQPI